jgi:hypothetical protein
MTDHYMAPPGATNALIVDLDGTLALRGDRSPYDWSRVSEDTVNDPIRDLVFALAWTYSLDVVFVSGRSDECRPATKQWLTDVIGGRYDHAPLLMRTSGDNRPDAIVKREIFDRHIRGKYNVKYVIDDRARVVAMWRSLGLTVLQVADGDF